MTTDNTAHDDLLVFVHIPKTGGTTLNSMLAHQYTAQQTYEVMMRGMSATTETPLISFSKIRRLKRALKSRQLLRVVHGHFDLSLEHFFPARARYVTFLRDPVDRAISHYFHYRGKPSDPIHDLAMRSSLIDWVSRAGLIEMDNGQTRRLAGEMARPFGTLTRQTLERAKANLRRFAIVGLTERFEESQILLQRAFSWPACRYPARNVGDHSAAEFDPEVLQAIRDQNRFDIELYAFATELFDGAVSKVDIASGRARLLAAPEHVEPSPSLRELPEQPDHRRAWSGLMSMLSASA